MRNCPFIQRYPRYSHYFSNESIAKLTGIMTEAKIPAGSPLFHEGDVADKFYYVLQGQIKQTKFTDDGNEFVFFIYQDGDFLGQLDPFSDSTHHFSSKALEDSVVGAIRQTDLESLIRQPGDFAVEFMKWMGLQHRITQSKLRDLTMFGKVGALSSQLIRLSNSYGEQHGNGVLISKRVTNTELANMIGATRESVNRMLSKWKEEEVIIYKNGRIVIIDIDHLRDIVQCENCPLAICRI